MASCSCKGIRTCLVCEGTVLETKTSPIDDAIEQVPMAHARPVDKFVEERTALDRRSVIFEYCTNCKLCRVDLSRLGNLCTPCPEANTDHTTVHCLGNGTTRAWFCAFGQMIAEEDIEGESTAAVDQCYADAAIVASTFTGVTVVHDVVSQLNEAKMLLYFDEQEWKPSQSGRRKQDYGPSVNFKRQKVKMAKFEGLPEVTRPLLKSMDEGVECLSDFVPVECGVIEYDPSKGAAIDRHQDDTWLWGERIATVSLLTASVMTFSFDTRQNEEITEDASPLVEIKVAMPARSLLVMQGAARNVWSHAVLRHDIKSRRISVTFRELASAFLPGGDHEAEGYRLVEIASSFKT